MAAKLSHLCLILSSIDHRPLGRTTGGDVGGPRREGALARRLLLLVLVCDHADGLGVPVLEEVLDGPGQGEPVDGALLDGVARDAVADLSTAQVRQGKGLG